MPLETENVAQSCRVIYRMTGLRQVLLFIKDQVAPALSVERINALVCHDDATSIINLADTEESGVASKYHDLRKKHPLPFAERILKPLISDDLSSFQGSVDLKSHPEYADMPSLRYRSLLRLPLFRSGRSVFLVNFWSMRRAAFAEENIAEFEKLLSPLVEELRGNIADIEHRSFRSGAPGSLSGMQKLSLCPGLNRLRKMIEGFASCNSTVLVLGETGVGKEAVAGAIHEMSDRKRGPFIKVNCGAIPDTLIDSELFGHEKGAFTGATNTKSGFFELASGGTLFLDEIGEMSLATQVRLLRVLEDGMVRHIGGKREISVDVRIIAATHNDLARKVLAGTFRKDLWYRLSVLIVNVPPLRERLDDLPHLVRHFVQSKADKIGLTYIPEVKTEELVRFIHYPWPGNIRELEHVVERAMVKELIEKKNSLRFEYTPLENPPEPKENAAASGENDDRDWPSLREMENRYIRKVLRHCRGKLTGTGSATAILDIHYTTLKLRMKELGIAAEKQPRHDQKSSREERPAEKRFLTGGS